MSCEVIIRLYGRFKEALGDIIRINVVEGEQIVNVLSRVDSKLARDEDRLVIGGSIRPGVLVFINGVDYELLGGDKAEVSCGDEIALVPVVHGG